MVWQLTLSVGVNRKFHVKTDRKKNDEFLAKMFVIYTHLRRIFVSLYQKFCCRSHFFLVRLKNKILKQPFMNNFPTRFIYDLRVKKNNLCWWWKMHIERKIMLISEVRIMQILLAKKTIPNRLVGRNGVWTNPIHRHVVQTVWNSEHPSASIAQ